MAQNAIGMIETRGLVVLVQATDAMLKAANVEFKGWRKVGSGLCTVFVSGDVAAVKASVDAGAGYFFPPFALEACAMNVGSFGRPSIAAAGLAWTTKRGAAKMCGTRQVAALQW